LKKTGFLANIIFFAKGGFANKDRGTIVLSQWFTVGNLLHTQRFFVPRNMLLKKLCNSPDKQLPVLRLGAACLDRKTYAFNRPSNTASHRRKLLVWPGNRSLSSQPMGLASFAFVQRDNLYFCL